MGLIFSFILMILYYAYVVILQYHLNNITGKHKSIRQKESVDTGDYLYDEDKV